MADWSKLVRKHQRDVLDPGEEVLATLLFGPHGSITRQAVAGGVGSVLGTAGMVAAQRSADKRSVAQAVAERDGATLAGSFWAGFGLISITDHRILVFSRSDAVNKRPAELVAAYGREAITGMATAKKFMKRDLTLEFIDGSTLLVDAGMAQPFDTFEKLVTES